MFHVPENAYIVEAAPPQEGAVAAVANARFISLKNLHKVFLVIQYTQVTADDITWTPQRATAVAPVGNVALATTVPVWSNLDCATSDVLTRRANALTYDSGIGTDRKVIVFEIDPRYLGVDGNDVPYDCIGFTSDAIAATNFVSAFYVCVPRYKGHSDDWQTVITD